MVSVFRLAVRPMAAAGILAGQVLHAAHRTDLPSLENQDPSGTFGDPSLPKLRITFLGDSAITAPGVVPLDDCWVRRVAFHLQDRYFVEALSVALGGSKARDVLRDQVDAAIATEPDLAYVCVGANDALRFTPIPRYEEELDLILGKLHDHVPAVGVSGVGDLGTMPRLPALARGFARVRSRSIDRAIARVAHRYPRVRKSSAWGPGWEALETDPEMFAPDLFHASGKGHGLFARAAIPVVEELLTIRESLQPDYRESLESSR